MDILGGFDGLKSILGVPQPAPTSAQPIKNGQAEENGAFNTDRATVSSAGSEVSQTASDSVVRMDKVEAVKAALAAGTYDVSPAAVASKMVDAILASN